MVQRGRFERPFCRCLAARACPAFLDDRQLRLVGLLGVKPRVSGLSTRRSIVELQPLDWRAGLVLPQLPPTALTGRGRSAVELPAQETGAVGRG